MGEPSTLPAVVSLAARLRAIAETIDGQVVAGFIPDQYREQFRDDVNIAEACIRAFKVRNGSTENYNV